MSGDAGTVEGEPIVYNSVTRIGNMFDETVAPGAATEFLTSKQAGEVALVRDHEAYHLLARARSGTLQLTDSPSALRMRARIADTTTGRETIELMKRGDLSGMSFSFTVATDGGETWHEGSNGFPLRVIRRIGQMFDVSLVTWPAYSAASARLVRSDVAGAQFALAYRKLAWSADEGALWEKRVFGESLYGRRIKPPAEAVRRAGKMRNQLVRVGKVVPK